MEPDLAAFLARHAPLGGWDGAWLDGTLRLRMTGFLGAAPPPLPYINSVRALVFRGEAVLVVRGPNGLHIVPGGRREGDETLDATLRREVLEETGWTLANAAMIGFIHFHIVARPADYAYPFSGFINLIYRADAGIHHPAAMRPGDVEVGVGFCPLTEVLTLDLSPDQHLFLRATLDSHLARG